MTQPRRGAEATRAITFRLRRLWPADFERFMRDLIEMPARHPERYTRRGSPRQRWILWRRRRELWPHSEYVAIIVDKIREDRA